MTQTVCIMFFVEVTAPSATREHTYVHSARFMTYKALTHKSLLIIGFTKFIFL